MGGRGSSSAVGGGSKSGGSYNHGLETADGTVDFKTKYSGSAEEVERADQITEVIMGNVYGKNQTAIFSANDIWSNAHVYSFYATPENIQNAKEWANLISEAGFSKNIKGATEFFFSRSKALNFIKDPKTAKEVIEQYGSKISEDRKPSFRIYKTKG